MGVWRTLGYLYAGFNILGGFIMIGLGSSLSSQPGFDTEFSTGQSANTFNTVIFNKIGGLALVYGGFGGIMMGILLIWALVKSGQIENIDKNIKIIAEWAKSQQGNQS